MCGENHFMSDIPPEYRPTQAQRCVAIVRECMHTDDAAKCERVAEDVFRTAYAIGGDYGERTIAAIAKEITRERGKEIP